MRTVNRIGEAEQERLGLLSEEYGEGQQIIGKILRHGLDSSNPDSSDGRTNQELLEKEVGDALAAIDLLEACGTLDRRALERHRLAKLEKLQRWLHCGTNLDAVEELLGVKSEVFGCGKCGSQLEYQKRELKDGWPAVVSPCCGSGAWTKA